ALNHLRLVPEAMYRQRHALAAVIPLVVIALVFMQSRQYSHSPADMSADVSTDKSVLPQPLPTSHGLDTTTNTASDSQSVATVQGFKFAGPSSIVQPGREQVARLNPRGPRLR